MNQQLASHIKSREDNKEEKNVVPENEKQAALEGSEPDFDLDQIAQLVQNVKALTQNNKLPVE